MLNIAWYKWFLLILLQAHLVAFLVANKVSSSEDTLQLLKYMSEKQPQLGVLCLNSKRQAERTAYVRVSVEDNLIYSLRDWSEISSLL